MARHRRRASTSDVLAAIVQIQRYTVGLTDVATRNLVLGDAPNIDVQILATLEQQPSMSPSELAEALGRARSTTSRSIARLSKQGMIQRVRHVGDGRRAELSLSVLGHARVNRFVTALADFFVESQPVVKDMLLLLGNDPEPADPSRLVGAIDLAGVLGAAGAAYMADVEPAVHPFGITTATDRFAIVLLAQAGQLRPAQLADELGLTAPGVTSLLDRLEARGLATRETGVVLGDGRAVAVRLTSDGTRAANVIVASFRRHEESLLHALSLTLSVAH